MSRITQRRASSRRNYLVEEIADIPVRIGEYELFRGSRYRYGKNSHEYYEFSLNSRDMVGWDFVYFDRWQLGLLVSNTKFDKDLEQEFLDHLSAIKRLAKNVEHDGGSLNAEIPSLSALDKILKYIGVNPKKVEASSIGDGYSRDHGDWMVENVSEGFNLVGVKISRVDWDFQIYLETSFDGKFKGWDYEISKSSRREHGTWKDLELYKLGQRIFKANGFRPESLDAMVRSVL